MENVVQFFISADFWQHFIFLRRWENVKSGSNRVESCRCCTFLRFTVILTTFFSKNVVKFSDIVKYDNIWPFSGCIQLFSTSWNASNVVKNQQIFKKGNKLHYLTFICFSVILKYLHFIQTKNCPHRRASLAVCRQLNSPCADSSIRRVQTAQFVVCRQLNSSCADSSVHRVQTVLHTHITVMVF